MTELDIISLVAVFSEFFSEVYKERIHEALAEYPKKRSLYVDFQDLDKFDTVVGKHLISEPEVVTEAAEEAIQNMNLTLPSGVGGFKPKIRFRNLPGYLLPNQVGAKNLGELVCIKGIVTQLPAESFLKVVKAHFMCQACGETYDVIVGPNFKPPRMCVSCKKLALEVNENKSRYVDAKEGNLHRLNFEINGEELVNEVYQDSYVSMIGIVRLRKDSISKKLVKYLDVLSVDVHDKDVKYLNEVPENESIPDELIEDYRQAYYSPKAPPKRRAFSKEVRHEVLQRGGHRCAICGAGWSRDVRMEIDHVLPISKGGTDELSNLQLLCKECNIRKGNKMPYAHSKPEEKKEETGRFDVDIITMGRARSQVEKIETILDIIKEKTRESQSVPRQEVLDEAEAAGLEPGSAKRILTELMRKGEIYEMEPEMIAYIEKSKFSTKKENENVGE